VDIPESFQKSWNPDKERITSVGLLHESGDLNQHYDNFEVRRSPVIAEDEKLDRKLYDARGQFRGELTGPGWDEFGRTKAILLSSYRPERLPTGQDWILVLDAR
jgi:hypothetical protein